MCVLRASVVEDAGSANGRAISAAPKWGGSGAVAAMLDANRVPIVEANAAGDGNDRLNPCDPDGENDAAICNL